uniref:Uncharacterized protein n=1 Tax=Glycine max TaxID=3847 RepID=C6T6U0_SOYBN|nr:unknown [Glycine max]
MAHVHLFTSHTSIHNHQITLSSSSSSSSSPNPEEEVQCFLLFDRCRERMKDLLYGGCRAQTLNLSLRVSCV